MAELKSINLIPKEALKNTLLKQVLVLYCKNKNLRYLVIISLIVILIILTRIVLTGAIRKNLALSKQVAQDIKSKLGQARGELLELEKIKSNFLKEESLQKQRLDFLVSSSSKNKKYSKLLADIPELVPQDMWINRCVLSENEIRVSGSTMDNQLITQFMDKLEQTGLLKNSSFISSEKQISDSHTIYSFEFTTQPVWESFDGKK